jgi:hypothetical protein
MATTAPIKKKTSAPAEKKTKPGSPPKAAGSAPKKSAMSDDHKNALAVGREESRIVRSYLDGLEASAPRRGRARTPESINRQLESVRGKMAASDLFGRLHLAQEEKDLEAALARVSGASVDMPKLEEAFVKVARSYGKRKGLSYSAWRSVGVSASVLKRAGIDRSN